MTDAQKALTDAVREYETRIYRDLPAANDRRYNARVAVAETLMVVARALGLREQVAVMDGPEGAVAISGWPERGY